MNIPNPPLYFGCNPPDSPGDGHLGLWFDRYFNQYDQGWNVYKEDRESGQKEGKRRWIATVEKSAGDAEALRAAKWRLAALCRSRGGDYEVFSAQHYFACGLGNQHPVENGFLWHPTLGTPYIPGAAVKGLVRSWMEEWEDFGDDEADREVILHRWFGSEDKDPDTCGCDNQAGAFVFFDALPVVPVRLRADVMTPHMGEWYEKGDTEPTNPEVTPADWHSPVPIPFLVADRPKFLFAIAPRDGEPKEELSRVMGALEQALEWLGAGAKTAVGYGRFIEEIKGMSPRQLALKLGKDRNKTEIALGVCWDRFLQKTIDTHGALIRGWENSANKNERKAYKTVFGSPAKQQSGKFSINEDPGSG